MSIFHCVQAARPNAALWDQSTLNFSVPYASLAMSLNTLLSISLTLRLLDLRRRLPSTFTEDSRRNYTSMEALIVESALPYGLGSFIFVVMYGLHSTSANLFVSLIVQLEVNCCHLRESHEF